MFSQLGRAYRAPIYAVFATLSAGDTAYGVDDGDALAGPYLSHRHAHKQFVPLAHLHDRGRRRAKKRSQESEGRYMKAEEKRRRIEIKETGNRRIKVVRRW